MGSPSRSAACTPASTSGCGGRNSGRAEPTTPSRGRNRFGRRVKSARRFRAQTRWAPSASQQPRPLVKPSLSISCSTDYRARGPDTEMGQGRLAATPQKSSSTLSGLVHLNLVPATERAWLTRLTTPTGVRATDAQDVGTVGVNTGTPPAGRASLHHSSGSSRPRSSCGRGPKIRRSRSSMRTSLMLASRRVINPWSSNSHSSLP